MALDLNGVIIHLNRDVVRKVPPMERRSLNLHYDSIKAFDGSLITRVVDAGLCCNRFSVTTRANNAERDNIA